MSNICVIGDLILDVYYNCKPRHNPEGNIPCYTALTTDFKLGGAGNVVKNLEALGSEVDFFYSNDYSIKMRISDMGKYIFRVDDESINKLVDKIKEQKLIDNILSKRYDYILVSDYNKGTITHRVARTIMSTESKIVVDCKPNHFKWFKGAYLIKPNEKEFAEMAVLGLKDNSFQNIVLTLGEMGMKLINKNDVIVIPGLKTKCIDVTGAGDTVIATLVHFLNKGNSLINSVRLANKAGAISVNHLGCYAVKENELVKTKSKR